MTDARTDALHRLLNGHDDAAREAAWTEFAQGYTRLIFHVARTVCDDHDGVMDHYTHVLEQLRADDFRRLRTFVADGRSELSTWLLVVAQRLCLDYRRHVYGRSRGSNDSTHSSDEDLAARRRLIDLIGSRIDLESLAASDGVDPEYAVRVQQLHSELTAALASLPPTDRLLVKLRFEDGMAMPDIAKNLDFPSRFHVYRKLDQILETLRISLMRRGVTDRNP
jgi:RNA polymerase sigma factor (sigma-70 family)